jgi:hypothetical protein
MAANQTQAATTAFDAEKYKSTTKAQWEKAAEP